MVNLVIVSHSHKLAEGVCELARQMADDRMRITAVGGILESGVNGDENWLLGTNAVEIAQAIEQNMSSDGVLVLVDLGSAGFAAEEAVQILPVSLQVQTRIGDAPLVEGAIVAAVEASLGKDLAAVTAAAEEASRTSKR